MEEPTLTEFLQKNWFRLVYYCVAFYCLLLPLCFLITFVRSRNCCGSSENQIADFENVLEMHRNGIEIDICRHLARIPDEDERTQRKVELVGLLFESMTKLKYEDYKSKY